MATHPLRGRSPHIRHTIVNRRLFFVVSMAAVAGLIFLSSVAFADDNATTGVLQTWTSDVLGYKELHPGDDGRAALLSYKEIEDDQTSTGTALALNVNNRLLRKSAFAIVRTPTLKDLPVGAYSITIRMKMQGLLNALGSRINVDISGAGGRAIVGNEFLEEDVYQDFTVNYEVRDSNLAFLDADAALDAFQKRPGITREQTAELRELLTATKGQPLALPAKTTLNAQILDGFNRLGKTPNTITVTLAFPQVNLAGTGLAPPLPSLRRLTIDTITLARLPDPDAIVLRDIQPQFAWRRPGETQVFRVAMHNRSKTSKAQSLRLLVRHGLTGETTVVDKPVEAPAGGGAFFRIEWPIPNDHPLWGQEVVAQIVDAGTVLSSASGWFTVHPLNNAVVIPQPGQSSTSPPGSPSLFNRLYASVPHVQTHQEYWAPTPFDGAGLVPDDEHFDEPYIAGNSSKEESIAFQKAKITENSARGIATFFYTEVHGTGSKAYDLYFQHPEICQGFGGAARPVCTDEMLETRAANTAALREWHKNGRTGNPPVTGPHVGFVGFNGFYPITTDLTIQGTLKLVAAVPYTGIRWDSGYPFEVFPNNGLGESLNLSKETMVKMQAANMARYKAAVREKFPSFEFRGNNINADLAGPQKDPFDFDRAKAIIRADGPLMQMVENGGSILEEAWFHTFGSQNDYKNIARNYYRATVFESAAFKSIQGFHDHMMYSVGDLYSPDMIYTRLFTTLGGAHLSYAAYGPIPESDLDLDVYATRFGEFFWDTSFEAIHDMDQKVRLDSQSDIWFTEGGWERVEPSGDRLYVLPIINPPVTERWFKNRFGVLPAPVRSALTMTVKIPEGYTQASVVLLDNHPQPAVKKLEATIAQGEVTFDLPELILFKVVAVTFTK